MACAYASRKTLTLCRLTEGCCANRLLVPRPCTQQLANDSSNMKTNEDLKRNDLVTLPLCNSCTLRSPLMFKLFKVHSSRFNVSPAPTRQAQSSLVKPGKARKNKFCLASLVADMKTPCSIVQSSGVQRSMLQGLIIIVILILISSVPPCNLATLGTPSFSFVVQLFKVESSRLAVSPPPFSFGIADWG